MQRRNRKLKDPHTGLAVPVHKQSPLAAWGKYLQDNVYSFCSVKLLTNINFSGLCVHSIPYTLIFIYIYILKRKHILYRNSPRPSASTFKVGADVKSKS